MKKLVSSIEVATGLALVLGLVALMTTAVAADLDTAKIDQPPIKGQAVEKEGVYRVTFPRSDVKVWSMADDAAVHEFGTWAAFTKGLSAEAMVMGDTVCWRMK
jgi:hypothetical protein